MSLFKYVSVGGHYWENKSFIFSSLVLVSSSPFDDQIMFCHVPSDSALVSTNPKNYKALFASVSPSQYFISMTFNSQNKVSLSSCLNHIPYLESGTIEDVLRTIIHLISALYIKKGN